MTPEQIKAEQIKAEQKEAKTKKDIFEYLDKLPEPYRTQAKDNYSYEWAMFFLNPRSINQALNAAFPFDTAKEGLEYWDDIAQRARRGEFDKPQNK